MWESYRKKCPECGDEIFLNSELKSCKRMAGFEDMQTWTEQGDLL